MLFNVHAQRLGRRAAGAARACRASCCRRCIRRATSTATTRRRRCSARAIADRRRRRRPAERAVRPGLLQGRPGQEHLRHRLLHADAHRHDASRPRRNGLITHAARRRLAGAPQFALEGSVFIGGAVVQWLRDGLQAIKASGEVEALAESVPDSGGVMFVPAFTGLGAPYWKADARGTIIGLTRGRTRRAHRARRAREHRVPERGAAAGDEPRRGRRRRRAGRRAAGRRRRLRQRPADAVPGRPARHPGGAAAGHRDHGPRRGLPRRPVVRRVRRPRRARRAVAGRAHVPADDAARARRRR